MDSWFVALVRCAACLISCVVLLAAPARGLQSEAAADSDDSAIAAGPCETPADPCDPRIVKCEYGQIDGLGLTVQAMQASLDADGCGLRVGVLRSYAATNPREPTRTELARGVLVNGAAYHKGTPMRLQGGMADYVGVVLQPFEGEEPVPGDRGLSGDSGWALGAILVGALAGAALVGAAWYLSVRGRRS